MANNTYTEIPNSRDDLELQKFALDEDGRVIVKTSASGTFQTAGLNTDALITEVQTHHHSWVKLNSLAAGQGINIQNPSDANSNVKINYVSPSQDLSTLNSLGYVGIEVLPGQERFYLLKTSGGIIDVYAKAKNGSVTLNIEQIG